jgi:hypothetical protein
MNKLLIVNNLWIFHWCKFEEIHPVFLKFHVRHVLPR